MDERIERLREHLEKHKHREQAFYSNVGLQALLDMVEALKTQNERLLLKLAEMINERLR